MTTGCLPALPIRFTSAVDRHRFRFDLATPADNAELLAFSAHADMPGAIRFSFDRFPNYLAALCVEGRHTDVLVCRDVKTKRLVATGHRSVKNAFVNGAPSPVAYLAGLRVGPAVRSASFLSRGYAHLKTINEQHPAQFHLTTIMEDNLPARKVLLSGRLGLPTYHDLGRFCCLALSLTGNTNARSEFSIRRASPADATCVVEFLQREGRRKQFFPEYRVQDFGRPDGLLPHLDWPAVFLAFRGAALVGVLAAWDQQPFRRWRVTGYAAWLGFSRPLLNLAARFRRLPRLPPPGSPLNYFNLALICIHNNDAGIFNALLDEIIRVFRGRYAFILAGLHERDSLLPALLARPHVPLTSRLYAVEWSKENSPVQKLDCHRIPYLELGSL